MTFCDFTAAFSFLTPAKDFSDMLHKEYYIAYQFPIMINFDAVDFSECRSEEVISFSWRSVYVVRSDVGLIYVHILSLMELTHD